MDSVDGAVGAIETDGTVGSDGKDLSLDEFSDSVAYAGLGMVCFPVSRDCIGSSVDCFPVSDDRTGSDVDCFAGSSDAPGKELL